MSSNDLFGDADESGGAPRRTRTATSAALLSALTEGLQVDTATSSTSESAGRSPARTSTSTRAISSSSPDLTTRRPMAPKAISVAPEFDPLALLGEGVSHAQSLAGHTATHSLASSNRTSEAGSEPPSPLSPVGKLIEPLLPAERNSTVEIGAPVPVAALVVDARCANAGLTSTGGGTVSASVSFRIMVRYCVAPAAAASQGKCAEKVQEREQDQRGICEKTSIITRTLRQVWSLRDELRCECPGCVLPPAPVSSGSGVGQADMILHIQQQQWECNCFIAALATHPVLAVAQATRAFFALERTPGNQAQSSTGRKPVAGNDGLQYEKDEQRNKGHKFEEGRSQDAEPE